METETKNEEKVSEETPKNKTLATCEDWEELFNKLANPSCNKCYGRGYVGWQETPKGRMPRGCRAKRCSLRNLQLLQRQQRIQAMKDKQTKKEIKKEETDEQN